MAGAGALCFSGRPCSIVDPLDHRRRQCPRMQGVEAFATGCLADLRARGHLHGQSCKPLACGRNPVSAVHRIALHRARENVGALEEQVKSFARRTAAASGQSASTATIVKPCSSISRRVIAARAP